MQPMESLFWGVRESMQQSCNMIITYMAPESEFRVIEALKKTHEHIPMIVYTTVPDDPDLACYEKAKGEEFNPKTTKMHNFRKKLREALKSVKLEAR